MWLLYTTINFSDGDHVDHPPEGPWTTEQVNAHIRRVLNTRHATASSFEFILVPKEDKP